MKKLILFFLLFSIVSVKSQNAYTKEMKKYQYTQNLKFHDKSTSPLTAKDLKSFKALKFYSIDKKYKVIAKLVKEKNPVIFEMPTTTTRKPLYIKYGTLIFTLEGKQHQLAIYQNKDFGRDPKYKDYLFLPFSDMTNGNGSYGGGRYIDVLTTDINADQTMIIDFNKSYNPYCAYNSNYSCPIIPKENHINLAVKAGIKAYKKY